jgi:hypothetical protein
VSVTVSPTAGEVDETVVFKAGEYRATFVFVTTAVGVDATPHTGFELSL